MFDLASPESSGAGGVEREVPALFWKVMALGLHAKLKGISCRKDNPSEITGSQSSRNNASPRCASGVMSDALPWLGCASRSLWLYPSRPCSHHPDMSPAWHQTLLRVREGARMTHPRHCLHPLGACTGSPGQQLEPATCLQPLPQRAGRSRVQGLC